MALPAPDARRRRFAALFEEHHDYVFSSLVRLGVLAKDAEDVTHELFLTVWSKLDELDPARPARPWLFAFAVRFASDHRKLARHREGSDERALGALPSGRSPEDDASRAEATTLALRALERLSDEVRAVFVAYELEELSMKDIASSLGIPVNTAYSRLRLAREQFGEACRAMHEEVAR